MTLNPKKIAQKNEMADKMKVGISLVASIVKRTLGPGGLPILIERNGQNLEGDPLEPMITKDGVTVANECASDDPEVDLTIQTVKAICKKTNRIAGDGTTTAIVLGEALYLETLKELDADSNLNPQIVREELELAIKDVVAELEKVAVPVKDFARIEQVANISANGEKEIGSVIRAAFEHVGAEGVVTIDEGSSIETTIDRVEGFQFARGAESQDRFFNNKERTKFEAKDALVIIYDGKIDHNGKLVAVMNTISKEFATAGGGIGAFPPILIIANDFSLDTLQLLLINKAESGLNFCAVRSPNTTTIRSLMLDDLAVYLGGTKLGNGGKDLQSAEFKISKDQNGKMVFTGDIGFVSSVIVDRYNTTLFGGGGTEQAVTERVDQLNASKEAAFSEYDRSMINDRVASLTGGIAKIGVGGRTELEIKEKYHRIEDALNASRAAIEAGVIPGGGAALFRIADQLSKSDTVGHRILSKALKSPIFQILDNIGIAHESLNLDQLKSDPTLIFDARNKKFVDAFEAGIIDPLKVTVTALENAASIAGLLSTCGGGITYLRKV
jgi:chaperonin GroEL